MLQTGRLTEGGRRGGKPTVASRAGLVAGVHLLWALCLLIAVGLGATAVQAQPLPAVPALTGRVVDQTGTLSPAEIADLSARLGAIEQRKGAQVAVLIVPSTQPESIEQYGMRVAEAWKIGRGRIGGQGQAVDDGVILIVAKNDRRMRIEVGYGLEGAIPDALASRIITESMAPRFRQGDFVGGITAAVGDMARLIDGETLPAPWQPGRPKSGAQEGLFGDGADWIGLGLIVLVGGLIATTIFGRFLGSLAGGLGAGLVAGSGGLPMLLAGGVGVGVFLFLMVFAAAGRGIDSLGRGSRGGGPVVMLPPGGWGGGGGGGFGGGGGGGFSGGGGGFGGGGASGGW